MWLFLFFRVLLPTVIDVSLYDLKISTNVGGNFRYDGSVTMEATVNHQGVKKLILHAKELHIEECVFRSKDGKVKIKANEIDYDKKATTVHMKFEHSLPKGECTFDIEFIGTHNDQMAGFYRSEYTGRDGKPKMMVSTQFEPLDARRCFPCFDEPARKAVFRCSLIVDDDLTALGNMPVKNTTVMEDGKRKLVKFEDSPKMSTYLLAFVVADMDFVETKSANSIPIRIYTPPNKKKLGEYALKIASKTLDLYDNTFGEPYPLPKLDMVAIPAFAAGAMENWGLVTYREVDLLVDEEKASSQQKQRVGTVVCHEEAHMWFGNLVTMAWWDGLWLNEAFASWTQTYAMDTLNPDWLMWEQFVHNDQGAGMRLDALQSSHPVQVPIHHAEEVEQVFDAISYCKGAAVVRLIHAYLGEDDFFKGLQGYMAKHKYGNTETSDLWQAWGEASGKPVKKVMASWTEQMGFPVVTVEKMTWAADNSSCTFELSQKWFLADGSTPAASSSKLWSIPLFATMGSNGGELVRLGIMDTRRKSVKIEVPSKQRTWIKLNGQQHVPMRMNYSPVESETFDGFVDAIHSHNMPGTDRAGMLLDAYALVKAGMMDPGALIKLLSAYSNETSAPVFSCIEDILTGLNKLLMQNRELETKFTKFASRIIEKPANDVGWEVSSTDKHLTRMLRATLIRLQAQFMSKSPEVQKNALERFERFAEDPAKNQKALPSDIKTSVIKIVLASTDDSKFYNKCMEMIDMAETTQEKKEIYLALGHARSDALKKKTLDWCTSGAVKKQDFFYPIASVSSSGKEGLDLTWDYLRENFERIVDMVRTASPSLLAAAVLYSCSGFATEDRAKEIEAFFKENEESAVQRISRKVDQLVESTRANAKFLKNIEKSEDFEKNLELL